MATDYDAPRKNEEEEEQDSLEELKARRAEASGSSEVDEDENAAAEDFELPGADYLFRLFRPKMTSSPARSAS